MKDAQNLHNPGRGLGTESRRGRAGPGESPEAHGEPREAQVGASFSRTFRFT